MITADTSAKMTADVRVHPMRSQVVLVSFVGAGVIMAIAGAALFGAKNDLGGAILSALALLFGGCAIVGWMKAQPATDNPNPEPASFQLPDGTKVSVDGRFISDSGNAASLFHFVQGMLHQQRLPDASAMLDANNEVLPNSQAAAKEMTDRLNEETEAAIQDALTRLRAEEEATSVIQTPSSSAISPDAPMPSGLNGVSQSDPATESGDGKATLTA